MKLPRALVISLVLLLSACGGGGGSAPQVEESPAAAPVMATPAQAQTLPIKADGYAMLGPIFNSSYAVEANYWPHDGTYGLFFQCNSSKACFVPDFTATPNESASIPAVPNTCRFPYVFKDGDTFLVCLDTWDGNVYLWRSSDLRSWAIQNNAQPILRRTPGTQWANIWNVAILPVNGRWHMLAETSATPDRMDLAYAWADPTVSLDFTPNEGPVVIPNGGNPELHLIAGKMVALHGMYHDRTPTDPWYTTYSTADPASPAAWTTHRDRMLIEQAGIDVCDPTYIEIGNGQALIAVSYDQNKVVQLKGPVIEP